MLAPVAVRAMVNVAPWHESFAALLIEIAFARSTFRLPFAGTSQPVVPFVCGDVTLMLVALVALQAIGLGVTAPSAIELT